MSFFIREAQEQDVSSLMELGQVFKLDSLVVDKKSIQKLIETSLLSFQKVLPTNQRRYVFVLENSETKQLVGTGQILRFTEGKSEIYLKKTEENLQIVCDAGKTQLGGLVLLPEFRAHPLKLGRQMILMWFLYMAMELDVPNQLEVSLSAPLRTKEDSKLFWDNLVSSFTSLSFSESRNMYFQNYADFVSRFQLEPQPLSRFSKKDLSMLGEIHTETKAAYKNLSKLGFSPTKFFHILDGGLFLFAHQKDIPVFKKIKQVQFVKDKAATQKNFLFITKLKKGIKGGLIRGELQDQGLFVCADPPGPEGHVLEFAEVKL